jgi:hypothetical protein
MWATAAGTCELAFREVSEEDAEAIYNKINAVAQGMKADGDARPIDAIRHDLGIALLRGTPLPEAARDLRRHGDDGRDPHDFESTCENDQARDESAPCDPERTTEPTAPGDMEPTAPDGPRTSSERPGGRSSPGQPRGPRPPWPEGTGCESGDAAAMAARQLTELLAGVIDERLATITGRHKAAGRRTGLAMRVAAAMQAMTSALAQLKLHWCDATTDGQTTTPHGQALPAATTDGDTNGPMTSNGTASGRTASSGENPLTSRAHGHDGYRPPAAMQRLVQRTYQICAFPSCNRTATRCDLDHTVAFHKGGPTCFCNLAPLCRHHHKLKQNPQWHLFQPWPGLLVWVTPAGKWHTVIPENRQ